MFQGGAETLSHKLRSVYRWIRKGWPDSSPRCHLSVPSILSESVLPWKGRPGCPPAEGGALCHPGAPAQASLSAAADWWPALSLISTAGLHTWLYLDSRLPRPRGPRLRQAPDFIWPCDVQYHGNEALSLCSGETWATMCQPGVQADGDKGQHTEHFPSLFLFCVCVVCFFFPSPLAFKETGAGMD